MNKLYKYLFSFSFIMKYVNSAMEGFIIEGEFTSIQMYPHQVFLQIIDDEDIICGGSIVNQVIVLTAAHCLENYKIAKNHRVLISYGSEKLNEMKTTVMKSFKIHEDYNFRSMLSDIALLRCKTPIRLSGLVKKVAIMQHAPSNDMAFIAGWGAINDRIDMPDYLKHTKQKLQASEVCAKMYTPKGAFCAGPPKGQGHPAVGDSGGALIINKYIQIGIVSYRVKSKTLVAYTNVSYYYAWISNTTAKLYCNIT